MKLKPLIPKSEARKMAVKRRSELSPAEIKSKTNYIIERLLKLDDFVHAKTVFVYLASRSGEVDTRKLIDNMEGWGKTIIIPKLSRSNKKFKRSNFMGWDHIVKNNEGYYEPIVGIDEELTDIDLFIVPALAISILGQRVGYGGGYYDNLLKNIRAPKIVLAFEFQVFENIETDVHDVRIDRIVTERRVINSREPQKRALELL